MKLSSTFVSPLLALGLVLGLGQAFPARAEVPVPRPVAAGCRAPVPEGGPRHGGMPGPAFEALPGLAFLGGLQLNEAQQDQLFDLSLKQARALRDQGKVLQRAEAELRAAAHAADGDEARLRPLLETRARAWNELTLLRFRYERQALEVLTPEQRRQVEEGWRKMEGAPIAGPGPAAAPAACRPDGRPGPCATAPRG